MKYLKALLKYWFCVHEWNTINQGKVLDSRTLDTIGNYYDQECYKCKKIKRTKLII